jgi:hypothetical protein
LNVSVDREIDAADSAVAPAPPTATPPTATVKLVSSDTEQLHRLPFGQPAI